MKEANWGTERVAFDSNSAFCYTPLMHTLETLPRIVAIVGPTGSGKTATAIRLAKYFNGEIISADSRQVYRELDIGTEKATLEEREGVPHHLIDICEVSKVYSVTDFCEDAKKAIDNISIRDKLPILAGGTFFYVDTLLNNSNLPPVSPNEKLRSRLEKISVNQLFLLLQEKDPDRAAEIDPKNPRRIIRALEIIEAIGKVPKHQDNVQAQYKSLKIGLEVSKEELREILTKRAQHALERGLVEETQKQMQSGIPESRLREIGHEYTLVLEHLHGTLSLQELPQRLAEKNWQYAKRQLTWLKRDPSIVWCPAYDTDTHKKIVTSFLSLND